MLVVADTSPINYLVLIQHEAILPALYQRVVIPPAVLVDLRHARTPEAVRAWVTHPPAWLEVRRPIQALDTQQFPKLGAGEREAIALAQELHAKRQGCRHAAYPEGQDYTAPPPAAKRRWASRYKPGGKDSPLPGCTTE
jgi:hypothetical protein